MADCIVAKVESFGARFYLKTFKVTPTRTRYWYLRLFYFSFSPCLTALQGCILDAEYLFRTRNSHRKKCMASPRFTDVDRRRVAQSILTDLQRKVASLGGVSLEDIRRSNPCLMARLNSYKNASDAIKPAAGGGKYGQHINHPGRPTGGRDCFSGVAHFSAPAAYYGGGNKRGHSISKRKGKGWN